MGREIGGERWEFGVGEWVKRGLEGGCVMEVL